MDHSRAPVLEALQEFRRRGDVVFGPPGHKQGRGADPRVVEVVGEGVFASDVLSLNGLDDRRESQGVTSQAEDLMADAVDADEAFFSTCGSSLSVKSAMISVAGPDEELLVSRNAHKSVVAGLIISGIRPVWVHPHFDADRHLAHPPEPEDVRRALDAHPGATGMLLITPTDWGTCADIAGVADVVHERDLPLIVDEAWGAHLPFHPDLPAWGMDAGADVVVTSVHKMGGAIEQSSVFHLKGDRVSPEVLRQREDLLGTTSSSALVYLTLDGWRRHMVEQGHDLLGTAIARAERVRAAIAAVPGLDVMGREVIGTGGAFDLDPLAITVDVRGLGITGFQAGDWLRTARHVDVGSADTLRVNVRLTHADDDETEAVLVDALAALVDGASSMERSPRVDLPEPRALELEQAMTPREAFFARAEHVPAAAAVGRVAAELVSPYPPGVPVLAPGERISQDAVDYLVTGVRAGMLVPDAADPSMETLRVVA
ncbi:aminotransferase class I/II-fold pyridoxal phosphate-dependent enzyme [Geodermatophilus sabuli]|uniref:Arginine/lysine/ornithine decarboxylase n=1 Tax=Geodermatophilus sabuli TaxID=1564158 RepID=A0A285EE53_9ACTN|nr:ornithine decarboxylase [Geodermatophilus sabuli]MBB3086363.1 arginine/lysine/ornithine decarboxylase [Geodermatophilus sabuli]SNX97422.1 Arginine/lysine/ornithine decarboxylase [Geodermatophilus sabuli]